MTLGCLMGCQCPLVVLWLCGAVLTWLSDGTSSPAAHLALAEGYAGTEGMSTAEMQSLP